MGTKNRKRKQATLSLSDEQVHQPHTTTTRTQVGRRVSNGTVQERQIHGEMLPSPHTHVQANLALADQSDNHLVGGQAPSSLVQEPIQQNTCEVTTGTVGVQMGIDNDKENDKKCRGPTHMLEIWGRQLTLPLIQLDFDTFGRPIGANRSKFSEFLGTIARNGMYCPLDVEGWHKMPKEYKTKMLHVVKSRYDISLGDEGWILTSINRKWRNWKSNLKARYFLPGKESRVLDDPDERVLPDQWANMLVYWNKEEVKARSEKNQVARSKRTMNHLTGKMSFAQVQYKLAKEKGRPPSRAELFDSCYTSKHGNTPPNVSKYLEEIDELRAQLPEDFEDPVGPNDLYAQVTGQDKPGYVRMFGEGVSPSDVWGEVPNRNMCKRVMLEQRSEMLKMKNEIAELHAKLSAQQNPVSQSSNLPRMISSSNQHLQVGVHVALKSVSHQGKIVAKGCVHSTNPNAEVGRQVLGENWCQVQVKVVLESEERLIRPYGFCQTLGDALGEMVAWPCDLVTPI